MHLSDKHIQFARCMSYGTCWQQGAAWWRVHAIWLPGQYWLNTAGRYTGRYTGLPVTNNTKASKAANLNTQTLFCHHTAQSPAYSLSINLLQQLLASLQLFCDKALALLQ